MNTTWKTRLLMLALVAAILPVSARAQEEDLSPADVRISTPVYHPAYSEFTPALGTYSYDVTWQGIPAATVSIDVEREGDKLTISTSVKTVRAIDLFYKLRYNASAVLSADDLMPERSVHHKRENSKIRDTEITFAPGGEISTIRKKEDGQVETLQFNPENFTLDPFSAAFLARSLDWKKGVTKYFDTFEGKNRYLIALTATDQTTMEINGQQRDVWVITPKVKKLGGPTQANKKLRQAQIYLTADKARDIPLVKSEVFIGSVKTKLVSFTPSTRPGVTAVAESGPRKVLR